MDEPALAVYSAAVAQYRNDADFKENMQKIESHYSKSN